MVSLLQFRSSRALDEVNNRNDDSEPDRYCEYQKQTKSLISISHAQLKLAKG